LIDQDYTYPAPGVTNFLPRAIGDGFACPCVPGQMPCDRNISLIAKLFDR